MAAFLEFFHAIDKDNTGVITIDDLRNYMHKKRYKAEFVTTWTKLFDPDKTGLITFETYCEVLGLKPDRPKAKETSTEADSRKQEPSDPEMIKPSTSESVQEVPIQQELASDVEFEKPSLEDPAERQGITEAVGQEDKEHKDLESTESSKRGEKGSTDSQPGENLWEPSRPQSRKRKHSKSPSQKDSIQVETTAPSVEAKPATPVQESGNSGVDIVDRQEITVDDNDMNGGEHLVESGIPSNEDPALLEELSTSSTKSVESKTNQPDMTKKDEVEVESIPTAPSADTDEAFSMKHPKKKELNKRGKKTSEASKRKKKSSESSKVSETEIVPSVENVEESMIPSLERVQLKEEPKSEGQTLEPLGTDGRQPVSQASLSFGDKGREDVEVEVNFSKTSALESAKPSVGKKGGEKKKREQEVSVSGESKQTHQAIDESEIKTSMEHPMEVSATLKTDVQEDHGRELTEPLAMSEEQLMDIEMEISASTTEVVESAMPSFESADLMRGSEKPSEFFVSSQEPSGVTDIPVSPKHKHKSPIPKSRRKKRSSKSGYSESSNSGRREEDTSPKTSAEDADVKISKSRAKSIATTLPDEFEGLHIVKRHPMQIVASPRDVPALAVPTFEKPESPSLEKTLELHQEGMDVEQTEGSVEPQPFNIEAEKAGPTLDSMRPEIAHGDRPKCVDEHTHIVGEHSEPIIPEPANVQESAVPLVERAEPCSPAKELRSEQKQMDAEVIDVQCSPSPLIKHFEEQRPPVVETEQTALASDGMEPEIASANRPEPVSESMHIVKKHPMHIIPSPTTIPGLVKPFVGKEESRSPEKLMQPTKHTGEQEQDVAKLGTASADLSESAVGSSHIVKENPMHIIPTPTNAPESEVPSTQEEKLEGAMETTLVAEEPSQASKAKQRSQKSGKKSPNSVDKKRGKKSPKVLPANQEATFTVIDPQSSPVSPVERLGDESLTLSKEYERAPSEDKKSEEKQAVAVEMDISPSPAETVGSANLSTELHESSRKKSPNAFDKKGNRKSPELSKRKPREKKPSENDPKETLSPTTDPVESPTLSVEHLEASGKKSSSFIDKKESKKSPAASGKSKKMQTNVEPKQHEGGDLPTKKRREKKPAESARAEEEQSTGVEMTVPSSMVDVVEPQNLPVEHYEPAGETSPSPFNDNQAEVSLGHEEVPTTADVNVIQAPDDAPKFPVVSSEKLECKDKSSKKRREKKSPESAKPEERDPAVFDSTTVPISAAALEYSSKNLEHQESTGSGKKSPDPSKERGKKSSESSPGQRKSPLTGDMDVQESFIPLVACSNDRIEDSAKKNKEETLESGKVHVEQPTDVKFVSPLSDLDIAESQIPSEEHQQNVRLKKNSPNSSDGKRGKKPSGSSFVNQEPNSEATEVQESPIISSEPSRGKDPSSKRKRDKESMVSTKAGKEQSPNAAAETTSSIRESPVPSAAHSERPKSGKKSLTKKATESTQKWKNPKAELSETSTKEKVSKPQRPDASKTPKKQAAKAAEDVTTLEASEGQTPLTTSDLPEQSEVPKLGKRRRGKETKAAEDATLKESEKTTTSKDSDTTDVKKSTNKKRKTTEAPGDSVKRPNKKDERAKGDKDKPKKPERRKRLKEASEGDEKSSVKKSKRPRVGHLECGRFPRSFATQVGHRVKQHRRDGAPVSTYALGKAPKGTQTKMSIGRRRRNKPNKAVKRWKLRSSLRRIGTIVILLAGRHRGKRAVVIGRHRFSGLLLITGPFKCNGIPVRRVHPDYVIATKTRIQMDKLRLPSRMQTKEYFARQKPQPRSKNAADNLFVDTAAEKRTYELKEERKEDQKLIDKRVIEAIRRSKQAKLLFAYLRAQFALSRHDMPHKMVF
ncbi:60S ribosomal protein L6 [Taenia crassiceps]|uniref:Large ribosomal subunit protein eL6 n=1 Tax=Taenia crassiceps TaxID=6207 RepID=A0ABR4Q8N2_9CEST